MHAYRLEAVVGQDGKEEEHCQMVRTGVVWTRSRCTTHRDGKRRNMACSFGKGLTTPVK